MITSPKTTSQLHGVCRRDVLTGVCWSALIPATIAATATKFASPPAFAAETLFSSARVATWPGLEYLEPLYELQLSVQALDEGVQDETKWPVLQKRLDKFFKGFVLSERNFYGGLTVQYISQIKYDDMKEFVNADKEQRFQSVEEALNSLEELKKGIEKGSDKNAVVASAANAKASLQVFFSMIPEDDIKAVEKLYFDVRAADKNRDGRMSPKELTALPREESDLWIKRVAVAGD